MLSVRSHRHFMFDNFMFLCFALCDVCLLTISYGRQLYFMDRLVCAWISGVLSLCKNPMVFYSIQMKVAETWYAANELKCLANVESV